MKRSNIETQQIQEEVRRFLKAVEAGDIALRKLNPGNSVSIFYEASNGWNLTVFNDAGCFDFVQHVTTVDGRSYDYDDLYGQDTPKSPFYEPPDETWDSVYGILDYWAEDADFKLQGDLFQVDDRDEIEPKYILTIDQQIKEYFARHPEKLREIHPRKFEELVAGILEDLGFGCELTPATRDGGCDIYAHIRTAVSTFLVYVECKRYSATQKVGVDIVQRVHGAAEAAGAHKGMIVTTSFFTMPAVQEQKRIFKRMDLVDYNVLRNWLQRYLQL